MLRKRGNRHERTPRLLAAVLLAAALSCGLASCKPTDFFTEVILSPYADAVDEDNPAAVLVNSPDAEQETDRLSALDWTDESEQTEDVQNLVVYSSAPNTDLETHHSIFDLSPRFPGIEASDGVRLSYDADAYVDEVVEQVPEEAVSPEESSTVSPGDAQAAGAAVSAASEKAPDDAEESPSEQGRQREGAGGSAEKNRQAESESPGSGDDEPTDREGGTSAGDSPEGEDTGPSPDGGADDPNNPGGGHTPSEDNPGGGETEDPYGGYDGTVPVYNPGDAFATVQHADSIAVLGTDAAVMAQAIGGKGAVCAMSDYAYNGLDTSGSKSATYLAFKDVFGGEAPPNIVLWARDGSSPDDLASIDALVSACGRGGVLVYDQRLGDQTTLFTDAQRRELYAADVQLVPVELSTVQGMIDAARVMGDALSESHGHGVCALDAKAMSDDYIRMVDDIVRACAATHGGTLGFGNPPYANGILLTKYTACPVSKFVDNRVYCYLSSAAEAGLSQGAGEGWAVDASKVVLFKGNGDWLASPVFFWQQCAGLDDDTCESGAKAGLAALWPIKGADPNLSGSANGALSRWLSTARQPRTEMFYTSDPHSSSSVGTAGIPSQEAPYLIVGASGDLSGNDVKALTVASMGSYYGDGTVTPYSILPPDGSLYGGGLITDAAHSANLMSSIRGERFLSDDDKLAVADVVRVNPAGLAGSWTEGSMESVLEAVWLTELYSHTASGHPYTPINDMGSYSVTINGQQCSDTRTTALAFYRYFYHLDGSNIEEVYSDIVPDSFEGLI